MEQCLTATAEGRSRKEREAGRREEELTAALRAEDERITKEKEISDKAARNSATAASSSDPKPTAPEDAAPTNQRVSIDVDPAADDNMFVTDRTPMDTDNHDDRTSPTTTRASKKFKPTSEFDERAPAQRRTIPSQGSGAEAKRPHVPAPSSPTISYKRDEPEDADMEDKKILSSNLRGVDITEVYSPQRVVDVCHKY